MVRRKAGHVASHLDELALVDAVTRPVDRTVGMLIVLFCMQLAVEVSRGPACHLGGSFSPTAGLREATGVLRISAKQHGADFGDHWLGGLKAIRRLAS